MALEDLTGPKYISDLNPDWPAGSDYTSDGDDHIRGIKNVLQRTFPNVTGPVNRSQTDLNNGSVPAGSAVLFYLPAAPVGWVRTPDITTDYMVRVVKTTDDGGSSGGSDNPILNNKVPVHQHNVSATTSNDTHNHGMNGAGAHSHSMNFQRQRYAGGDNEAFDAGNDYTNWSSSVGDHTHAIHNDSHNHTCGVYSHSHAIYSDTHNHTFNVSSGNPLNATTGNWTPRYMNMIMCTKS